MLCRKSAVLEPALVARLSGRGFRMLTVGDDSPLECLALVVDTSFTALQVIRELDRVIEARGQARMVVSDKPPSSPQTPCWPGRKTSG